MRLPFSNILKSFRRPAHEQSLLVVDIGTLFVHVAIFAPHDSSSSSLILKGEARVARKEGGIHAGLLVDTASIITAVKEAIEKVVSSTGISPKRLRIAAGGGILFGRTIRQQYRRENSKIEVDDRELLHILQKIEWRAFEDIRKEFARETGRHDTDVNIVTARVTQVTVDGYAVESPLEFRGQSISMDIFHVYAPTAHIEALSTVAEEIGITNWEIVAEHDSVAQLLSNNGIENSILFDIGGVSTELALIKDGSVITTDRFAFGGQSMTHRIARHLKIDIDEAEKIKRQYSAGSLGSSVKRKITMLTNSDIEIWEQGVMFALSAFARRYSPLPSQWFLYGGGSLFPKFSERLTKQKWIDKLPFVQEPSVDVLPQDIIEKSGILQTKREESFLALAPLYSVALANDGGSKERIELDHQLRRVLRIIQS